MKDKMKLTKTKLKEMIREEARSINEMRYSFGRQKLSLWGMDKTYANKISKYLVADIMKSKYMSPFKDREIDIEIIVRAED